MICSSYSPKISYFIRCYLKKSAESTLLLQLSHCELKSHMYLNMKISYIKRVTVLKATATVFVIASCLYELFAKPGTRSLGKRITRVLLFLTGFATPARNDSMALTPPLARVSDVCHTGYHPLSYAVFPSCQRGHPNKSRMLSHPVRIRTVSLTGL